ncbi:unnamed protein product, partial [Pylaiella littoralis]
ASGLLCAGKGIYTSVKTRLLARKRKEGCWIYTVPARWWREALFPFAVRRLGCMCSAENPVKPMVSRRSGGFVVHTADTLLKRVEQHVHQPSRQASKTRDRGGFQQRNQRWMMY